MAYLDETGLAYYDGKLKDWIEGPSSDILHKTGTETVSGEKVFSGSQVTPSGNASALLVVKDPNLVKGETPATNHYLSLGFIDSTGNSYAQDTASRLAVVEYKSPSEADPEGFMQLYDVGFNGGGDAILRVGHDKDNIRYATAPATSDDRTNSTDIVTRGYMEASEWNWQKTKKVEVVTFKPVPESDLEPVVDFMFTETPPAEGEKGPDNPSTITGVTQAEVTRLGKNLLPPKTVAVTTNGVTFTPNSNGSITVTGTPTGRAEIKWPVYRKSGITYSLSGCPAGGTYETYYMASYGGAFYDYGKGVSFITQNGYHDVSIVVKKGADLTGGKVFWPQLEIANAPTSFEQYEGNDYTIQLGDTYYGGSLDVATGVMTVTCSGLVLDGTEDWIAGATGAYNRYILPISPSANSIASQQVCTHFLAVGNLSTDAEHFIAIGDGIHFFSSESSLDNWKLWLAQQYTANTPVTVVYGMATPTTVQLTPTQIKSLPALDKYEPRINTVYTDQEAVQVGYQRFYDENRLAAIEARLDALEGN